MNQDIVVGRVAICKASSVGSRFARIPFKMAKNARFPQFPSVRD
jgi:hypothetical protein